ncbi:MAG: phage integrase SAM-like domain-containing protein, partial [Proteobacteria bacterium]|nr:phage integrase SAM-like domain-containing protein [Pseudomonadota bacterium]
QNAMTKIKIPRYKIILFKSKTLSNGDHPIMLRVTYQRIRKYYSLKLYSSPEKWNEGLGLFNRNKEGKVKLSHFERRADKTLRTMGDNDQEFSFAKFEELFFKSSKPVRFFDYWENVIESLKEENRIGTAASYNDALRSFKKFQKNRDLLFTDVYYKLLERYRKYLKARHSVNTSGIYLRSMRVICNHAIKNKIIDKDLYPFEQFKIKTEETVKRALRKSDIEKIHSMKIEKGTKLWHSRNFFLFGYLLRISIYFTRPYWLLKITLS